MMRQFTLRRESAPLADAPVRKETVEMFLARGGRITQCPSKPATGALMYAPVIAVDGYTLPIGTAGHEYLPNFVRDLPTYDIAQADRLTNVDDGSVSVVREDLARSVRSTTAWHERQQYMARREDADIMEEL